MAANLQIVINAVDQATGVIQNVGKIAGAALLGLGAAGVAGFGALAVAGIDMNKTLETATLQFGTLMGSADKAREHVKFLFEFAKETPFETEPILKASRMLQTFGGDALNTKETLTLVGDAAAAASQPIDDIAFWFGRAYSAIQSGKPFGEASMRLQEMGLLGPDAVTQLENLTKGGGTAAEKMAVLEGALGKFSGAMKDQAGTWDGLWSSITDTVKLSAAEMFTPVFDAIKSGMAGALEFMSSDTFTAIVDQIKSVMTALGGIITLLTSTDLDATTEAYARLFNVFGEDVANTILRITQFVTGLFGAFSGDQAGLEQAERALTEMFGPDVVATAEAVGTAIKGAFDQIVAAVSPFITQQDLVVSAIVAISAVIIATAVPALVSLVVSAAPVVLAIGAIIAIVALARMAWENDWGGIQEKTAAVWEAIGPIFQQVQAWLGEQLPPLITALGAAWEAIWPVMQSAFETWWNLVSPVFEKLGEWAGVLIPLALETLKTTFENQIKLITTALELVPPAIDAVKTAFNNAKIFIENLHIPNPFQALIDAYYEYKRLTGGSGPINTTNAPATSGDGSASVGAQANAVGTPFFEGGWTMVGEYGPELARLPRGTQIQTNSQTQRALEGVTIGENAVNINLSFGGNANPQDVARAAHDGVMSGLQELLAAANSRRLVPGGAS